MTPARLLRDATLVTAVLLGTVYAGSARLAHLDPALLGYLAATLAAAFVTTYRVSAFWRRPASAVYGRALVAALGRPRDLLRALGVAGQELAAQRLIARRSRARWLGHLALSGGTLAAFAVTVPLVLGWLHFEAVGEHTYRAVLFSLPVARFAADGVVGWLVFHTLGLAAVAVVLGCAYFLLARRRERPTAFHLAPLLVLLAVALSGLVLPVAARAGVLWLFPLAAGVHEATVVLLLLALPRGKLVHLFIRPLHVGARLVRAAGTPVARCRGCAAPTAPVVQRDAVRVLLAAHGFRFAEHEQLCPACRRRQLALTQADLLGAQFQPPLLAMRLGRFEPPPGQKVA